MYIYYYYLFFFFTIILYNYISDIPAKTVLPHVLRHRVNFESRPDFQRGEKMLGTTSQGRI